MERAVYELEPAYPEEEIKDADGVLLRNKGQQLRYLRETKTLCIARNVTKKDESGGGQIIRYNRPDWVSSKSIVRISVSATPDTDGTWITDVFRIDSRGSQSGRVIANSEPFNSFIKAERHSVYVKFEPASPEECAAWMAANFDTELKATGIALQRSLEAVNVITANSETLRDKVNQEFDEARKERESVRELRRNSILLAIFSFLLGTLFDVGEIQDRTARIPDVVFWLLLATALVSVGLLGVKNYRAQS